MLYRDLLPPRYYNGVDMARLWDAIEPIFSELWEAVRDVELQLRVETATWGLALYERDYGLTPNVSETYRERRERIRSHMRGSGTSTLEMLRSITEAYTNGETAVDDLGELFRLAVTFVGTIGGPSNMEDLKAAVAAARPAHMLVDYIIRYNLWCDVKSRTWGDLAALSWHDVKEVAL